MRRVQKLDDQTEACLWMGCEGYATHEVINVAGETEASGCEFHAHQFKRKQNDMQRARDSHPST